MDKSRTKSTLRRGSVYIAVTGTGILVSLIGMTVIHLSRLELKNTQAQNELAVSRQLAQSGVEFALANIDFSSFLWRMFNPHGVARTEHPVDYPEPITYRILDKIDGNVGNDHSQEAVSYTHLTLPTIYSV